MRDKKGSFTHTPISNHYTFDIWHSDKKGMTKITNTWHPLESQGYHNFVHVVYFIGCEYVCLQNAGVN